MQLLLGRARVTESGIGRGVGAFFGAGSPPPATDAGEVAGNPGGEADVSLLLRNADSADEISAGADAKGRGEGNNRISTQGWVPW
eukprot:1186319-Prorocentrum_minimum.AAC.1